MKWPAPRYATFDAYVAEAMLLGWRYDPRDHTMGVQSEGGGSVHWLCAELHVPIELGRGFFEDRRHAVLNRELGPKAHPDYQGGNRDGRHLPAAQVPNP